MQPTVEQFIQKYNLHTDPHTRYIDLISEVGELGKTLIQGTNYGKAPYTQTPDTLEEIGDCLFSLLALCSTMNIQAETALATALKKYETRFAQKGHVGSEEVPCTSS